MSEPGEPPRRSSKPAAAAGAAMAFRPPATTASTGPTRSSASASSASAAAASSTSTSSSTCRRRSKPVNPVAVCDVWDGDPTKRQRSKGRGLYPSAKRCGIDARRQEPRHQGLPHASSTRRTWTSCASPRRTTGTPGWRSTPWTAGKDVYMRKADDPHHRRGASRSSTPAKKTNKVVTVGVQSMADPTWQPANEYITGRQDRPGHAGADQLLPQQQRRPVAVLPADQGHDPQDDRLGHVARAQVQERGRAAARADAEGMPFDRAVSAQWRCYWPFGGGMFTDLFVHQTTHLIAAMGVRFPAPRGRGRRPLPGVRRPRRAGRGHGGRRLRRGLPGHHLRDDVQRPRIGEVIRGHTGTIKFDSAAADPKDLKRAGVRVHDPAAEHRRRPAKPERRAEPTGRGRPACGSRLKGGRRPTPCGRTSWPTSAARRPATRSARRSWGPRRSAR